MAEVFTKYVFDTTEASASLGRFKQEVRELQGAEQSSQKTFQTNAQKRAQLLKEEQEDLRELKRRRDEAYTTKEISLYNKRIAETEKRVKNLKGEYGNLEKSNRSLVSSFQRIGAAIGVAFGIREILTFTKRASELAAEAEGVRTAFERVGGTDRIFKGLQTATRGAVDQLELMRLSVQASNFKIPLEQMATLFEFAATRAIETGQSVDKLVADITLGLGRKSMRVLDNLGLSWTEMQAAVKESGDFTTGIINVIQDELGTMGDVADTSATRTARSQARMKNAMIEFGEAVTPVITRFNELLANAAENLTRFVNFLGLGNEEAAKSTIQLYTEQRQALLTAQSLQREYDILSQKTDLTAIEKNRLSEVTFELTQQFGDSVTQINKETGALEINREALIKQIQMRAALQSEQAQQLLADRQSAQVMIEQAKIARNLLQQMEGEVQDVRLRGLIGSFLLGKDPSTRMKEIENLRLQLHGVAKQDLEQILRLGNQVVGGEGLFGEGRLDQIDKALESMGLSLDDLADQLITTGGAAATAAEGFDLMMQRASSSVVAFNAIMQDTEFSLLRLFEQLGEGTTEQEIEVGIGENLKKFIEGGTSLIPGNTIEQTEADAERVKEILADITNTSDAFLSSSFDLVVAQLDKLLEAGDIAQEVYDSILTNMEERLFQFRTQQTAASLGAASDLIGIIKQVYETTTKDAEKSAGFLKALTIFQILLDQASAIASAVAAAAAGSITAVDLVIKIAAAVGTVIANTAAALSQARSANQPARPSFGHGGEIKGKPHTQGGVHIEAEKGEYIVKSSAYAKAKEAVHAINSERFDTYVTKHYIEPLLKSKRLAREDQDRGFARNIAESLHLDGKAEHYLKQIARKGNNARIENFDELARLMRKDNRGSTY